MEIVGDSGREGNAPRLGRAGVAGGQVTVTERAIVTSALVRAGGHVMGCHSEA